MICRTALLRVTLQEYLYELTVDVERLHSCVVSYSHHIASCRDLQLCAAGGERGAYEFLILEVAASQNSRTPDLLCLPLMLEAAVDFSEEYFLLGCDAVHSRKLVTTDHRNLLLSFCALKMESLVILL
jgi:hypothetical protein